MTRTTMPQLRGREIATGKLAQLTNYKGIGDMVLVSMRKSQRGRFRSAECSGESRNYSGKGNHR